MGTGLPEAEVQFKSGSIKVDGGRDAQTYIHTPLPHRPNSVVTSNGITDFLITGFTRGDSL